MVSVASPAASASEGEIVEMVPDMASKAQPAFRDNSVDRLSRHSPVSSNSSSDIYSRRDTKSRRINSRSRSRSPYRHASPRGEKRRRGGGESDNARHRKRNFRTSYEDSSHRQRPREPHEDPRETRHRRDRDRQVYRDEPSRRRSRSRSRSPFTHRKHERVNGLRLDSAVTNANGMQDKPQRSVKFVLSDAKVDKRSGAVNSSRPDQPDASSRAGSDTHDDIQEASALDEAAQIEARRRRREALKAKLKSHASPLLAETLHDQQAVESPDPSIDGVASSRSVSPSVASPGPSGTVASPAALVVEDDEDLVNHRAPEQETEEVDEPSAADYDPTMDMKEDRARHDYMLHHEADGLPLREADDKHLDEGHKADEVLTQVKKVNSKAELDMFADDDDDDDMFAPEASTRAAVKNSKPKELAATLLDNWDDPDGYYRIIPGELLDGRYHVQTTLGKGMFSAVVRAVDSTSNEPVAIKIIRNNETMKKAGLKEIEILQRLADADPDNKKHVIRLEREFEHKGHLCMVFEHLSINLREVLKKFGRDVGINLKAVRSYAHQMFLALSLLKKCNILHADIKPDNMLVNDSRNILKICDLGSAGDAADGEITPYLVSRFYRAPEIILGMPYDFAIDMWSIGCTLYELYTGKILFTGRNNNQMLRSMMECRGKFSLKMLKKSEFAGMHFDEKLMFMSEEKDKVTGKNVIRLQNFLKPTRDLKMRLMVAAKGLGEADIKELNLFVDLLDRCLTLNPEKRLTPGEALKHPFISRGKV